MKKVKVMVLAVMVIGLFQGNLFSIIYSRIEGVVTDKDTGMPLVGAKVVLFYCPVGAQNFSFSYPDNKSISINVDDPDYMALRTDSKGFFRYEDRKEGEYFLCVFKPGYASYGQIREARLIEMAEGDDMAQTTIGSIVASFVKERFFLKEGKIKHFRIAMELGGALEVKIIKKTPGGIEEIQITSIRGLIRIQKEGESQGFSIEKNREDGLPTGVSFIVKVDIPGYSQGEFNVVLEKGKTKILEYVLDYTVGQVIHGFAKKKVTGAPIKNLMISAGIPSTKIGVDTFSDENGEFWLGGPNLKPGIYNFVGGSFFKKIDLKTNEKVEILIEI